MTSWDRNQDLRHVENMLDSKEERKDGGRFDPRTRVIGFDTQQQKSTPISVPSRRDSRDSASDLGSSPRMLTPPGSARSAGGSHKSGNFEKLYQQHKTEVNVVVAPSSTAGTTPSTSASATSANAEHVQQQHSEKPKTTKAERRAIQEAQRAAKAARDGKGDGGGGGGGSGGGGGNKSGGGGGGEKGGRDIPTSTVHRDSSGGGSLSTSVGATGGSKGGSTPVQKMQGSKPGVPLQYDDPKKVKQAAKKQPVQRTQSQKQVKMFSHLPQYEREASLSININFSQTEIHPEVIKLGLKFAEGIITGGVARTVAMLEAFKAVIVDFIPHDEMFSRSFLPRLNASINFLIPCRPLSIPMGNAIRYLKEKVAHLQRTNIEESKRLLLEDIDNFITEKIIYADKVIADHGVNKIKDGDVVLTYARSNVVEQTFLLAHSAGIRFSVVIADARPHLEGKKLLKTLSGKGISCTYIHFNSLSYQMKQVTKVFIGAAALLSNGNVISRCGTASVAMMARAYNRPVMVCCESFKFSDRVLLDSICMNELGDPDDLLRTEYSSEKSALADWRDQKGLLLLNLVYDLTPVEFVNMVLTEVGMIPPTSVPVIIREYQANATRTKD